MPQLDRQPKRADDERQLFADLVLTAPFESKVGWVISLRRNLYQPAGINSIVSTPQVFGREYQKRIAKSPISIDLAIDHVEEAVARHFDADTNEFPFAK